MVSKDTTDQRACRRSRKTRRGARPGRRPVDFTAIVHFYNLDSCSVCLWHPLEFIGYLLFSTIWRGQPVHCNVEIDGMIYDNSLKVGITIGEYYHTEPWRSIAVPCEFKELAIATARSLSKEPQPKWPAILDSIGIWPKWLKVPCNCVALSCIMLGLPIVNSRHPNDFLRRLADEYLPLPQSSSSTAAAAQGHVGSGGNQGAQETREG